jgi:hypothetical protein
MKVFSRKQVSDPYADNRKSKACPEQSRGIQNRKLVGILALVVAFVASGAMAQLSNQEKSV